MSTFSLSVFKEGLWTVVQCAYPDVATQGGSEDEAWANMREALELHFRERVGSTGCHAPAASFMGSRADRKLDVELPGEKNLHFFSPVPSAPDGEGPRPPVLAQHIGSPLLFREVRLRLEAGGFRGIIQTINHAKFVKVIGDQTLTAILPHYTELTPSVIASILRQAGLSADEFMSL